MAAGEQLSVLHYVGYDRERGGILALVRALAGERRFECWLGVNPGFVSRGPVALATVEFPRLAGDTIGLSTLWKARGVARQARRWLHARPGRVFHGHSRAGLLVALWLHRWGERRVLATVHCYGRQRWFYRAAARRLGDRLWWLTPSMQRYYAVGTSPGWEGCLPGCIPAGALARAPQDRVPRAELVLGCAGGLVPVKQWDLALAALARLPASLAVRLVHAGGEDGTRASAQTAARLRQLVATLGLSAKVSWLGEVEAMDRFYADIDCLVLPSRWEAFSVSALEAAAAGVPLLAADAAGNADLITSANLGWTFEAGSVAELAREITVLATTERRLSWRPDREALKRFGSDAVAARHADVYRRILAT